MKYVGSKAKHAKEIIKIILEDANKQKIDNWIEPFAGGMNAIDKAPSNLNRIAIDINYYLIEMFRAAVAGWIPPDEISLEQYKELRHFYRMGYLKDAPLIAFAAIGCSYSGKWFGGYARGNTKGGQPRNYCLEAKKNLLKQIANLKNTTFVSMDYRETHIPKNSIVYCDPPYENSLQYKDKFDSKQFWVWATRLGQNGHHIYISEYNAPSNWKPIWQKTVNNTLVKNTGSKKGTEKLFKFNDN